MLATLFSVLLAGNALGVASNQEDRVKAAWEGVKGVFNGLKLAPVYNVRDAAIPSLPDRRLTMPEVETAVVRAGAEDAKSRPQKLEELRKDNLIGEQEYRQKRAAILEAL